MRRTGRMAEIEVMSLQHDPDQGIIYCNVEGHHLCYRQGASSNVDKRGAIRFAEEHPAKRWHVRYTPNYGAGRAGWVCSTEELPEVLDEVEKVYRLQHLME